MILYEADKRIEKYLLPGDHTTLVEVANQEQVVGVLTADVGKLLSVGREVEPVERIIHQFEQGTWRAAVERLERKRFVVTADVALDPQ